jgi:hypothetical protein
MKTMIKASFKLVLETIRGLLHNRGALAIFAGLYVLLLAALFGFVATREATIRQVLMTLLFAGVVPAIFFLLQAAIINLARHDRIEWQRVLRSSCRLALLTLPLILISVGSASLLNRWQAHFPAPQPTQPILVISKVPVAAVTAQPLHWPTIIFASVRSLLFGILLPLTTIRLWVELADQDLLSLLRTGWRLAAKKLAGIVANAFAPQSFLIYAVGLIFIFLIPYLLLFVRFPLQGAWRELTLFTMRLVMVFGVTLVSWVVTLTALARLGPVPEPESEAVR